MIWQNRTRKITREDAEWPRLPQDTREKADEGEWPYAFWTEYTFLIWLPGASESKKRLEWSSDMTDLDPSASATVIMNELGADGWELVSQTVRANAMGPWLGYDPAAQPIAVQYWFKRPVS